METIADLDKLKLKEESDKVQQPHAQLQVLQWECVDLEAANGKLSTQMEHLNATNLKNAAQVNCLTHLNEELQAELHVAQGVYQEVSHMYKEASKQYSEAVASADGITNAFNAVNLLLVHIIVHTPTKSLGQASVGRCTQFDNMPNMHGAVLDGFHVSELSCRLLIPNKSHLPGPCADICAAMTVCKGISIRSTEIGIGAPYLRHALRVGEPSSRCLCGPTPCKDWLKPWRWQRIRTLSQHPPCCRPQDKTHGCRTLTRSA